MPFTLLYVITRVEVIDDLIVYKTDKDAALICVNAANIENDWSWISSKTTNFDIKLTNSSDEYSLIALQGPENLRKS